MFKILSLDGGGSKGVYTLGVLNEVERKLGRLISDEFDLVFGTSTGSIIGSLIAVGKPISEIKDLYFTHVPDIMKKKLKRSRTKALKKLANETFSELNYSDMQMYIGIVTTHIEYAKPMIFKSSVNQAHGRAATFEPGFGAPLSDAVIASCSAYPFFDKQVVKTLNQGNPRLMDGGFVANNPTLFAIAEAIKAFNIPRDEISVLSVGVGEYPEPNRRLRNSVKDLWPFWLTGKTLDANTNTNELIRSILLDDIHCIRVNESYSQREYATDMFESDVAKLETIFQLGRVSYAKYEKEIEDLLEAPKTAIPDIED
jgi:uncharacterized protein